MRVAGRSPAVALLAILGAVVLAVSWTMTTAAVQLLATTALIMGGRDHPLSTPPDSAGFVIGYMDDAVDNYIDPDPNTDPTINRVAVIYPAQFFPVSGLTTFDDSVQAGRTNLHSCLRGQLGCSFNPEVGSAAPAAGDDFIVYGYSESAVIVSLVKRDLINGTPPGGPQNAEIFLAANAMRPNGGILARGFEGLTIPGVGITFYGPTPTNSCQSTGPCYETTDAAQQYDLLGGDAPAVPWSLLSWANSAVAAAYLHGAVASRSLDDPTVIDQGTYGDTQYYLFPAQRLPLLMLPEQLGVPGPILAVLDAPLRVWIEATYVRDRSPGEHVGFQLLPSVNPITFVVNLVGSIPVGIDDGLQEAGLGRPLGTPDVFRPFGVGGPTYDKQTGEPVQTATLDAARAASVPASTPPGDGSEAEVNPSGVQAHGVDGSGVKALELDASENKAPEPAGKPAAGAQQDETVVEKDAEPADAGTGASTPAVTEQDWPKVRGPIVFDRPKPLSTLHSGDRPLQRVWNALTGQRPDPEDNADEAGGGEQDALAGQRRSSS